MRCVHHLETIYIVEAKDVYENDNRVSTPRCWKCLEPACYFIIIIIFWLLIFDK